MGEWPENAKALIVAIILFTTITAVQFVAAIVSNSDALLVDCASMLVDAMTYVFNLHAEIKGKDKTQSLKDVARRALISSGFSIVVLYGITAWGLSDAIGTLMTRHVKDDLDPSIVLVFGILGFVFDSFTLLAFRWWGFNPDETGDVVEVSPGGLSKRESSLVNMCSALTHVIADSIRSLTSVLLGLVVILDRSVNGSKADGYATFVVASTILLGNMPLIRAWSKATRDYFAADDSMMTGSTPMTSQMNVMQKNAELPRRDDPSASLV